MDEKLIAPCVMNCSLCVHLKNIGGDPMEIKRYSKADETFLFDMLVDEGEDWSDYHGSAARASDELKRLLQNSYIDFLPILLLHFYFKVV